MSYKLAMQALEDVIEEEGLKGANNFRIARSDDKDAVEQYKKQAAKGKGRAMDTEFFDSDMNLWLIGCNYKYRK